VDPRLELAEQRIDRLEQHVERLQRLLRLQFALSRSTAVPVDTGVVQTVQGQIDPLSYQDGMPTLLNYGFSSSLPVGGDKAVIFLGGDRSQGVVVATGHKAYRYKGLLDGQSVMHDMWGHSLLMSATGVALIGNLTVTGAITATGGITAGFGTGDAVTLQGHKHGTGAAATGTVPPSAGT
jgi:phage gp45-like